MKIYIRDIAEEGLPIKFDFQKEGLDQREDDELAFLTSVALTGKAFKAQDELIVTLEAEGRYRSICSRCLEPIENDYHKKLELYFEIGKKDDSVDITDDVRQEILVTLPPKILCGKSCKGICPECGENLNNSNCKCQ